MYPLVEIWQASKESKAKFCAEHQINIHTFTYWVQKYEQTKLPAQNSFISLDLAVGSTSPNTTFVRYPNGVELHLSELPTPQTMSALIKIIS